MKNIILTLGIFVLNLNCFSQQYEKIIAFNDTFMKLPKSMEWTNFLEQTDKNTINTLPNGKWYWYSGANKYYFSIKDNFIHGDFIRTDSTINILETGTFINGIEHGFFKYYIDGYLGSTRLFVFGGVREEILYYKNGFLKRKVTSVKVSGNENLALCTFYHESGFISSQGYNGDNGKTGVWEYFDFEGNKLKEESYKKGKLLSKESNK